MVFLQLSQVTPWWITGQAEQVLEEVMGPVGIDWRATGVAEDTMHCAFSLQQVSYLLLLLIEFSQWPFVNALHLLSAELWVRRSTLVWGIPITTLDDGTTISALGWDPEQWLIIPTH